MRSARGTSLVVLAAMVLSTLALVAVPAGAEIPPPAGYTAGTGELEGTESFQNEEFLGFGNPCFKTTRSVYSVRGTGTFEGVTATGQPVVYQAAIAAGEQPYSDGPIHVDVENTAVYYHGPGGTYGDHPDCSGDRAEVPAEFRIWATDHIYRLDGGGAQVPCVGHGTFTRGLDPQWQAQWTLDADCTVVGNGAGSGTGTARAGTGFTDAGDHAPCFDVCPNNIKFDYVQYLPFVGQHVGVTGPASAKVNTQAVATANYTDDGQPVAGAPITFSVAGPGATTPAGATVATRADGRASFSFTSATVGDYVVTASTPSHTPGETVSGTLPVQFTPPPPPTVVLSGPTAAQTDETTPVLATFTDNDAAVANVQVNFSVTGPGAATPATASINTNSGGKALFNFSGNRAGNYTVTASATYFGHNTSDTHTVGLAINTFYREAALTLPSTEQPQMAALVDPAGDYAYFGSNGGITKIDLHTFQRVGVLTLPSGESAAGPAAIDPAGVYAYFANTVVSTNAPEYPGITKVDLRTFQRVGVLNLPQDETRLSFAVIDPAGHYLYTGSHGSGFPIEGTIIKINLDTFEWADVMPLGPDDSWVAAAVISPAGDFAYFGTIGAGSGPAHVVKVDLATFTQVGSAAMASTEHSLFAGVIDPAGSFAYFSTGPAAAQSDLNDAKIVKIDLTTMQRVGGLVLNPSQPDLGLNPERQLKTAAIDPAGNYAYFATAIGSSNNSTLRDTVVKIDLRTFQRAHAIQLNPGENLVRSAVISPDGTHAYFGSASLGKVVKVALTRPPNPGLFASNDAYATDYVTPLSVAAPGVLANDVDTGDADPLTAGQASDPPGGSVVLNADGSFTYTPEVGFSGTDTFTYTATDAKDYSAPATVSVSVGAPSTGVSSVGGGACGYYTHVGLFNGPPERRGCGQTADIPAGTSPSVSLPAAGSAPITATKPEGAMGLYGPAAIFSGQWPEDAAVPTNSGPLSVSTQGSTGEGGSATSSADVVLFDTPVPVRCFGDPPGTTNCAGPGGVGPGPVTADEVHSTCAANESGLSASASFVNGIFDSKHDLVTQLPIVSEPIPDNPPPNYTRSGTLDHVGDSYTVVFNEQILGPDSIVVNAVHMYLLGPTAVGDMVVAQSRCAASTNVANAAPVANDDSYSVVPGADLVVAAAGVLGNDTDADAQALGASKVLPTPPPASGGGGWTFPSDPAHGSLELGTDGSFTYTPDAGFEGTDTFTYLVTDPRGASDQATVTVTVAPALGISASPASVNPGAPVTATWTGIAAPTATDWVGLYDSSAAPNPALLAWAYTNGSPDGTLALTVPAGATPGATYELRLFANNSYTRLATSAPFAVVASAATVSASPASVNPGAPVTATWSAIAAPTATDWVGLYDSSTAPDSALVGWTFTNGSAAGSLSLTVPAGAIPAATYELRLFSNNSYNRLATSSPLSVVAPAQTAVMVSDVNPGSASSASYFYTDIGGTVFFRATSPATGLELWKTDGTAAGTVLVKDINPGTTGSVEELVNLNGTLLFAASDGISGQELWTSDGTAGGTVRVADTNPGPGGMDFRDMTVLGTTLYFTADDGTGRELWKTDGTTAGTVLVKDGFVGTGLGLLGNLFDFNGTLFFKADGGTGAGAELWKSDGTAAGTVQVADINPGTATSNPGLFCVFNGALYFTATDAAYGSELWKTDGTAAGTVRVTDINPLTANSGPDYLVAFNGSLFFSARDSAVNNELWKSDGTAAGTVLVKDIRPGSSGSLPWGLTVFNGSLYFSAIDGTTSGFHGRELWKSDGTTAGTVLVKDINPGSGNALFDPTNLKEFGSKLYFAASDGTINGGKGNELWQTDGTSAGTVLVTDIRAGTGSSGPDIFVEAGGTLYFVADDGAHGYELWRLSSATTTPPAIVVSPSTVTAGGPVTATWSGIGAPSPTDWVGLYDSSLAADPALLGWAYTNGAASGSLNLTVPAGATPGSTYELRMFTNNSYVRLATSTPFSVATSNAAVSASPTTANPGAPLTATWSGIAAPSATDWVGLYDSSATPNTALLNWAYTNGSASGSLNLVVPSDAALGSTYELRLFTANSYMRLATSAPFSVATSTATISASPSSVAAGSPVVATWSGIAAPSATDWVGLYASSSDPDPAIVAWAYSGGAATGSLNLTVPSGTPPGTAFELRLYSNNSYTRLATSAPFSVT